MKEYKWERHRDNYYYYEVDTGKIRGLASKIALSEIWIGLIYIGDMSYTINDEKHLGQYITMEFAKEAVQRFWDIQNRTLLEQ